jgi:hypothetical protein
MHAGALAYLCLAGQTLGYRLAPGKVFPVTKPKESKEKSNEKEVKDKEVVERRTSTRKRKALESTQPEEKKAKPETGVVPAFMEVLISVQAGRRQWMGADLANCLWASGPYPLHLGAQSNCTQQLLSERQQWSTTPVHLMPRLLCHCLLLLHPCKRAALVPQPTRTVSASITLRGSSDGLEREASPLSSSTEQHVSKPLVVVVTDVNGDVQNQIWRV